MYTKEDVIKFGTYLLSEQRSKFIEMTNVNDSTLRGKLLSVTQDDFAAVWPEVSHVLTAEDIKVNGPIVDEVGVELVAGDVVEIPTSPEVI